MKHRFLLPLVLAVILLPVSIALADVSNLPNLSLSNSPNKSSYTRFLSEMSPDYRINKNVLSLTKVSSNRRKEGFMFVMLMNQDKVEPKEDAMVVNPNHHERNRMHLLWTGSKKLIKEQKMIKDRYPVDVSIANYDDGYASGELNLVLPNKKPKEVTVSFVWSF